MEARGFSLTGSALSNARAFRHIAIGLRVRMLGNKQTASTHLFLTSEAGGFGLRCSTEGQVY
jgi:hypothetical protein